MSSDNSLPRSYPAAPVVPMSDEPPRSADLVIVGGGIVGAATAFYAAREGLRPVVIERRPGIGTLTTPASTGAFRAQFDNPEEVMLVQESIALFLRMEQVAQTRGYTLRIRQQGYLFVTTSPERVAFQKAMVERQRSWGLTDVEWLDGAEARSRFPYLSDAVVGARFRQGDGWLDVRRLTAAYAVAAQETGARFVVNTAVTGFDIEGGRLRGVATSKGLVSTEAAVIAAGPFAGEVAALAGVEVPLNLVRRQKLVLPDVPEVPQNAPMTIDEANGSHWRPALQGAFLLRTWPGVPPGPPLEDVPTSADFAFDLLDPQSPNAVGRISPFWNNVWAQQVSHWFLQAGQYDYTPDHRPFLGPTHVPGLYVNCGYSGHGIMTSGGGSRLVVDTIVGRVAGDGNPFRLDRPIEHREFDVL